MTAKQGSFAVDTWVEQTIVLPDGRKHRIVVDSAATDPVSTGYLTGEGIAVNGYLVHVMLALLSPGDRVLDLGAFAGEFALAAATYGCEVAAVEANPTLAAMVTASAQVNGYDALSVVNAAVGEASGTVGFVGRGPWGQVQEGEEGSSDAGFVQVPQLTVDELVANLGWPSVDFVKLDVEGSEMRALAGASSLLSRPDAPALLFESNISPLMENDTEPRLLLEAVEDFGYALHRIMPREIIRCNASDFQPETVADYIALKGMSPSDAGLAARVPLSLAEVAERILSEARLPQVAHRRSIAWQLQFAVPQLVDRPDVQQAVRELQHDPDESVRATIAETLGRAPELLVPATDADVLVPVGADLLPPMAVDLALWLSRTAERHPVLAALVGRAISLARRVARRDSA
ncbi:MAG TPA: FkbM family methyltransferase [Aeromicrobium sp.]|nr:FkbM family methyltransferase [Aeromicrobium sp.]